MNRAARLELRHPAGTTRIVAGPTAVDDAAVELAAFVAGRRRFVVTTPRVAELHSWALERLAGPGEAEVGTGSVTVLEVPDGEAAKTPDEAVRLWRALVGGGAKRDSRILVLGGGSASDLGGFVAGTLLRGVKVALLPTTLLGQVDAAIGGKTAIDLPEAKNSVGIFHHPSLVVADARFLVTLPLAELRSGLVEVVKMAALLDADLLAEVERDMSRLLAGDVPLLGRVVAGAAAVKARVVERDPGDHDERRLLNFGHTLGHAIEAALDYRGILHGEAVAYGMLFALRLGRRRGLPMAVAERLRRLLLAMDLPPLPPLDPDALVAFTARDKKAAEAGVLWVLPIRLCEAMPATPVPADEVRAALPAFLADPFSPIA